MTEIENNELLHQVYFEKYKNKEVKDALKVLASANKKISDKIKKTKIVASKARYKAISDELKTITAEAKADYEDTFEIEELLSEEMESQLSILEKGIYVDKKFRLPGTKQLKESVLFKPIDALNHRRFDETFNYFQENLYSVWDSAVRTGFLTGQSTADIVKTVMGSVTGIENDLKPNRMSQIRKSVENNTRTILQAFADEAHRAVFEENEDVIEGYKILATLDRRTCLLCGSLTSKVYKTVKDVPELPVHYSCRCVMIPVTKWDKEFPGKQASEFGEVDGDLTYEQWLASQPENIKKEILGGRYDFYNEGKSLNKQFFNNGDIISLKSLKLKNMYSPRLKNVMYYNDKIYGHTNDVIPNSIKSAVNSVCNDEKLKTVVLNNRKDSFLDDNVTYITNYSLHPMNEKHLDYNNELFAVELNTLKINKNDKFFISKLFSTLHENIHNEDLRNSPMIKKGINVSAQNVKLNELLKNLKINKECNDEIVKYEKYIKSVRDKYYKKNEWMKVRLSDNQKLFNAIIKKNNYECEMECRNYSVGGYDMFEDFLDGVSGGRLQKTLTSFGHGSMYSDVNVIKSEMLANYGALKAMNSSLCKLLENNFPDLCKELYNTLIKLGE